jgi:carbonic anhydrase/acetyltransferase-like protein (isoleucine patch superfamily)
MAKKYKLLPKRLVTFTNLTNAGKQVEHKMHRIVALRDIPRMNVKAGELGGWVNRRGILSHEGDCWIGGEAKVYIEYANNSSRISDNALVTDQAIIYGSGETAIEIYQEARVNQGVKVITNSRGCVSHIYGSARLFGNAVAKNPLEITGTISGDAAVLERSSVMGDAHVCGQSTIKSSIVLDMAHVMGNACVTNKSTVSGNSIITDGAEVNGANIRGHAMVSGVAKVEERAIVGERAKIAGRAVIHKDAVVGGSSIIKDDVVVSEGARVLGKSIISKNAIIGIYREYTDFISEETPALASGSNTKALTNGPSPSDASNADVNEVIFKLNGMEKEISAYGNDIVKLLKFPIMSDLRDGNTLEMMLALKNAKNIDPASNPKKFRKAVKLLERKFMKAESNARIICATAFSEEQRKKADKASDLFAVACNEASSEQEKKNAFKQGFRQLEGVVDVTDSAIENMRIKVGIPELEA